MEPGSRRPTVEKEPCWAIVCPYCYAQPDSPCMTEKGRFALNTHRRRREQFENPSGDYKRWHDRPVTVVKQKYELQERPEFVSFLEDAPEFTVTDKNRDKYTLEEEDFDPWWDDD